MHLATTDSTTISIPKLRHTLNGRVITPGDPDYDQARTVFVGGIDRHPAVIIKAADANDVARAVSLARESGLELAVRSGGHSTAGQYATAEGAYGLATGFGDTGSVGIGGLTLGGGVGYLVRKHG